MRVELLDPVRLARISKATVCLEIREPNTALMCRPVEYGWGNLKPGWRKASKSLNAAVIDKYNFFEDN